MTADSGRSLEPTVVADIFRRDGIVIIPGYYHRELMDNLAAQFDDMIAQDPNRPFGGGADYVRLRETRVQVWSAGGSHPLVEQVMNDPGLVAMTRAICGEDCFLPSTQHVGIFSTPRDGLQGWHQDSRSRERLEFHLNRIVFPRDVHPEQGELFYVPGSHTGPDLPTAGSQESLPGEVRVAPTAGTLVMMHTRCFHRVGINRTDIRRTQCNSRARPAAASEMLCNFPVFTTGPWNFAKNRAE